MNNRTEEIIATLEKEQANTSHNAIAIRYGGGIHGRIQAKYQLCLIVANRHHASGDFGYLQHWFNEGFYPNTPDIKMFPFHFEEIEALKQSLEELLTHYEITADSKDLLRDIKDENPVYIVAFLIPQIGLS